MSLSPLVGRLHQESLGEKRKAGPLLRVFLVLGRGTSIEGRPLRSVMASARFLGVARGLERVVCKSGS